MKFVILSDEFFYSFFKPEGPSGLAAGLVPSITVRRALKEKLVYIPHNRGCC